MILDEIEKIAATKNNTEELWKRWKDSNEDPEHFKPLIAQFKPLLTSYTNKFSRNAAVPKTSVSAQAHKQFVLGCRSWDPAKGQLNTHVTNYLKKLDRFVGDYLNTGKITEPRRRMINQFTVSRDHLTTELNRAPSFEEISKHMNEQYANEDKMLRVKPADLMKLETELARKDLSEEMTLDDPEHWKTPTEQQAIIMMHYSTPIEPGKKHPFRLTTDEFNIFKKIHPLGDDGSIDYSNSAKLKDIAVELNFSAPKVSRSLKAINKKIKNATQYI